MRRITNTLFLKPFAWLLVHFFDCEVYYYSGLKNKCDAKIYYKMKF